MEPARTPQQIFTVVEGGSPGHMMRAARERLGLSIDDVCAHLKMMPAQIRSMESDSLDGLPPGGYARAFIKGYARFLGLDADQVVNSLVALNADRKDVVGLPAMKISPTVAAQREADALEEDAQDRPRRDAVSVQHNFGGLISEPSSDSRLVKYSLVALVIGLLVYLFAPGSKPVSKSDVSAGSAPVEVPASPPAVMAERIPAGQPGAAPASGSEPAFPPGTVMVPAQPTEPPAGAVVVVPPSSPVQSPSPVTPAPAATVPAPAVSTPSPSSPAASVPQPPAVMPAPAPASAAPQKLSSSTAQKPAQTTPERAPPSAQKPSVASAEKPVATPMPAASGATQRIRMVFTDRAYITIRDRDGHVLMAQLNAANTEKIVEGNPPFKVIIGNARAVAMEYKGRPYDLSAHTKDDVARFTME